MRAMRSLERRSVKPGAEQVLQRRLAVMHAVAILDDNRRTRGRRCHESTRGYHESERERRTRH